MELERTITVSAHHVEAPEYYAHVFADGDRRPRYTRETIPALVDFVEKHCASDGILEAEIGGVPVQIRIHRRSSMTKAELVKWGYDH